MNASPICFTTRPSHRLAASRTRFENRATTSAAFTSPIASASGVKLDRSTKTMAVRSCPGTSASSIRPASSARPSAICSRAALAIAL